jgi:predicted Zn-dependent peptidase
VRSLTPAQIQAAAQKYFDTKNYVKFVLLPEKQDRRTSAFTRS